MQTRATTVEQTVIRLLKAQKASEEEALPISRLASEVASSLAAQCDDAQFCYVVHRLEAADKPLFVRALLGLEQRGCVTLRGEGATVVSAVTACYIVTAQNRLHLDRLPG